MRWLVLAFGLSIIAGALYLVVPSEPPPVSAEPPPVSAEPPREFDAPSRANLERVLREVDREPAPR